MECGEGGYRYVKYTCCGKAAPPPPPAPPSDCSGKSQGSETSCKDAATWKQYASQDCEAAGSVLTAYSPGVECGGGGYRYVKYTCCGQAPLPPAPRSSDCTDRSQSDETSCKPPGTWQQYASEDCQAAGVILVGFTPDVACGFGNYRGVKYTCCPAEASVAK